MLMFCLEVMLHLGSVIIIKRNDKFSILRRPSTFHRRNAQYNLLQVEGKRGQTLERDTKNRVILQIHPNSRQMLLDRDVEPLKHSFISNSGQHQHFRCVNGSSSNNGLSSLGQSDHLAHAIQSDDFHSFSFNCVVDNDFL